MYRVFQKKYLIQCLNRSRSDTSLKTSKFMNSPYNQMARRCLFCHKQSEEPRKKYLNGQL